MDLIAFTTSAVLITLMPGPDILFVITQAVTRGKKAGVIFAAGLCSGLFIHIAALTLGISVLIRESPRAFLCLKILGAIYLFYLGIKTFIQRNRAFNLSCKDTDNGKLYSRGIIMNVLNPKVILFFLAFLPQFVRPDSENVEMEMLTLGLIFIAQAFIIFTLVAFLSFRILGGLMRSTQTSKWTHIIVAVIYCIIGIGILTSHPGFQA